MGCTNTRQKKS